MFLASLCTNNHTMKLLVLLVLLFSVVHFTNTQGQELQPIGETEYRVIEEDKNTNVSVRRRMAPYELCSLCKCCAAANTTCITMPCCFGIDCQLPSKPFGVCAFLPKTCNCTSCAS